MTWFKNYCLSANLITVWWWGYFLPENLIHENPPMVDLLFVSHTAQQKIREFVQHNKSYCELKKSSGNHLINGRIFRYGEGTVSTSIASRRQRYHSLQRSAKWHHSGPSAVMSARIAACAGQFFSQLHTFMQLIA